VLLFISTLRLLVYTERLNEIKEFRNDYVNQHNDHTLTSNS